MLSAGAEALSPSLRSRVNSAKGKHLAANRDRPFASLRVTWCDCANYQGLFFKLNHDLQAKGRHHMAPCGPAQKRWNLFARVLREVLAAYGCALG